MSTHEMLVDALKSVRIFVADELDRRQDSGIKEYINVAQDALDTIDGALYSDGGK